MKPGQGKNKGSGFERTIGQQLSLWLSRGDSKDLICRTVNSGGQFTFTQGGNPGDLMAQKEEAFAFFNKVTIECKHWKNLEILQFIYKTGDLYDALLKVKKEADSQGKDYWLVARQNNRPTCLFMSSSFHNEIKKSTCRLNLNYNLLWNSSIAMYKFDEFLKVVPPEEYLNG